METDSQSLPLKEHSRFYSPGLLTDGVGDEESVGGASEQEAHCR